MAPNGPQAMSAIWSLTGAKRTWQEKLVSVAIDPCRTSMAISYLQVWRLRPWRLGCQLTMPTAR